MIFDPFGCIDRQSHAVSFISTILLGSLQRDLKLVLRRANMVHGAELNINLRLSAFFLFFSPYSNILVQPFPVQGCFVVGRLEQLLEVFVVGSRLERIGLDCLEIVVEVLR